MKTVKLATWGNAIAIRIPKQIAERHNFQSGEEVRIEATPTGFAVKKVLKVRKYDPEELFAGVEKFPKDEIVDWGKPVGREVW